MTNPNCGMCGNLNVRGFCNLTACSFPSNKTETIQVKKPTNADRIRAMTDEELAELIGDNIDCSICKEEVFETTTCPRSLTADEKDCYGCWLNWLKQEATDGT